MADVLIVESTVNLACLALAARFVWLWAIYTRFDFYLQITDKDANYAQHCSLRRGPARIVEKRIVFTTKPKSMSPSYSSDILQTTFKISLTCSNVNTNYNIYLQGPCFHYIVEALGCKHQLQHSATRAMLPLLFGDAGKGERWVWVWISDLLHLVEIGRIVFIW